MKATASSKNIKNTKIINGITWNNRKKLATNKILQANPRITFNKVCPAIKFMNNLTPKLIGFAR